MAKAKGKSGYGSEKAAMGGKGKQSTQTTGSPHTKSAGSGRPKMTK